ncbi:MAG TPA: sulfite exporter TauE/SafE family protein [Usitatibacter sp.]|nr:sulfite exporter TauE/SafE family protein [Usitatibacter sp.]
MIDTAALSPWLWVVGPAVIVLGYLVFGLSGFGSTIVTVPILAHFLPISYLVPLLALIDCVTATVVGRTSREHLARDELKALLPITFVGFVVGVTVLVKVPDVYLRTALGIFAVAVGIHGIVNPVVTRRVSRWWSLPTGIFGGAMSTTFGTGGPIYATYLTARLSDKSQIRATMSTLIAISAIVRAVTYVVTGLVTVALATGALLAAPFAWLGLKVGTRIHVGLSQQQMRRVIGALLVLTGSSLLIRIFV